MNIVPSRTLAIATAVVATVGIAVSVAAETRRAHEAQKVRPTTPVVATKQGESHSTWRYFGGPKGGLWPAPSN